MAIKKMAMTSLQSRFVLPSCALFDGTGYSQLTERKSLPGKQ
jgi:hypothetical protein